MSNGARDESCREMHPDHSLTVAALNKAALNKAALFIDTLVLWI